MAPPPPTFLFSPESRVSFDSKDEIEKQIEESESLRFGSATFWNTFL
jgi:hypothetical protein